MLLLGIVGCWLIGSCALGPLLSWIFFYPVRRRQENHALHEGSDTVVFLGTRHLGPSDPPRSKRAPKAGLEGNAGASKTIGMAGSGKRKIVELSAVVLMT